MNELGESQPKSVKQPRLGESGNDNLTLQQRLVDLQNENDDLKQIVETMAKDMEQIRKEAQIRGGVNPAAEAEQEQHKEVLFELRRQLFKAQNDVRTLSMENDVLKGTENY